MQLVVRVERAGDERDRTRGRERVAEAEDDPLNAVFDVAAAAPRRKTSTPAARRPPSSPASRSTA